jgi:hypothetical protein
MIRAERWLPALAIGIAGLGATVSCLGNQFTYDDIVIVTQNPAVQSLAKPWTRFAQSYWPKPFSTDLYRPLTTLSLGLQWELGGGKPWLFHAVSVLEYLLVCLAVYALARAMLPPLGAWAAAAFFAVHPVHVEATAIGVNQAELVTALCAAGATLLYLQGRRRGDLSPSRQAAIVGLYLMACLTKEHGLVLPGLLGAAELTLIQDGRPWGERIARIRPFYLTLLLAGVAFLGVRTLVLHDVVGTFAAEAFRDATIGGRALTMLGVVREWARLLLWPAHLQTDYTPREIDGATTWEFAQTLGAFLLVAAVAVGWWCRRRQPVVTFGLLWIAIALFPVSNVLVPTGIVLAERSLFLASVGMMLVVGAGVGWAAEQLHGSARPLRAAAAAALALVVTVGAVASFQRQVVWRDQQTLFQHMVEEAPLSYKAHWGYGDLLFRAGQRGLGEAQYRVAIALFPFSWYLYTNFGDRYRTLGLCAPAVKLYHKSLMLAPEAVATRSSLIACQLYLGDYRAAKREIRIGMELGKELENLSRFEKAADSALAIKAPSGSVRVTVDSSRNSPKVR